MIKYIKDNLFLIIILTFIFVGTVTLGVTLSYCKGAYEHSKLTKHQKSLQEITRELNEENNKGTTLR